MNMREFKGDKIIDFKNDFTVIDIETTGLSIKYDDIIEVGALKIRNNTIVDKFNSLVKTDLPLPQKVVKDKGITDKMLEDQPYIKDILPSFLEFIGDDVVLGHNVNFDINFIYDEMQKLEKYFSNDFMDTLIISRKLLPNIENHKLSTLCEYYKLNRDNNRSLCDCENILSIYLNLKSQVTDFESYKKLFKKRNKYKCNNFKKLDAKDILPTDFKPDEDCLLFNKICVFTGTLEKMPRKQAMQLVVNIGGKCENNITKRSNYLILGNNDYCKAIKDGKSSKQKKAEKLILEGQDLQIIPEDTFYDIIME